MEFLFMIFISPIFNSISWLLGYEIRMITLIQAIKTQRERNKKGLEEYEKYKKLNINKPIEKVYSAEIADFNGCNPGGYPF